MVLNIGKEKKQGKDWEGGCAVERDTHITIVIALLLNGGWGEEKKIYCFYRLLVPLLFSRCTSFFGVSAAIVFTHRNLSLLFDLQ